MTSSNSNDEEMQVREYYKFLAQNYSIFRKDGAFCDVTLKVGEQVFKCHRLVLASNSKYFVTLFKNDFNDGKEGDTTILPTEYVDQSSFSKLLDAMYGEPFNVELNNLIPLFTTSLYLQLTHFINHCKRYITNSLETVDTIALVTLPQLHFDQSLYAIVKKYISQNFSKLSSRLTGISLEVFQDLLSDPELFVINGNQLLDFGKQWINYDLENRRKHLQHVASLLKPFHTPTHEMLELVNHLMDSLPPSNCSVEVGLNALLEWRDTSSAPTNHVPIQHELLTAPMFFLHPSGDSEVVFGAYRNNNWEFWNELNQFQLPIATPMLKRFEGVAVKDMIYFTGELKTADNQPEENQTNVLFQGLNVTTREWIELRSPRSMPTFLATCNSVVYSYEGSVPDNHQISVFEPVLNRWLRIPKVNYPREEAGIATSDHALFMVGGILSTEIGSSSSTNIIEMYDSRRGTWSRICVPDDDERLILNSMYSRVVCFLDNKLYMVGEHDDGLIGVDLRNNKWLDLELEVRAPVEYLLAVDRTLWNIGLEDEEVIEVLHPDGNVDTEESILNPNFWLKPISMPYSL